MRTLWFVLAALTACVTNSQQQTLARFREAETSREAPPPIDGRLDSYVAHATAEHPSARAAFERWRAATHRIATRRGWPRPTISYAAMLRPVETRVGPQRQRVGLRVPIAWPGVLRGEADSAAAMADASGRRFAAEVVALRQRVADAYWLRWLIEARERSLTEQRAVLDALAEALRARIAVGQASLGDLQTIELRRARLDDAIASLGPARRRADAMLRAATGLGPDAELPVIEAPPALLAPAESLSALRVAALERPEVIAHEDLATANERAADAARQRRFPTLGFGLDWIETGPARMRGVAGSGDDALMLGVTVSVPTDVEVHRSAERAARAEAEAERAAGEAQALTITAEVDAAWAEVEDALRQARLYEDTLLPQAQAAYESLLGQYQSERGGVATLLLAQRELLELALAVDEARARYARAWAALERAVGRPVAAAGGDDD